MTTEDVHKSEEVKFIRLPSRKAIMENTRFLLSASTLLLCIVALYGLVIQQIKSSYSLYFLLIILLLSGLILASKSHDDILRLFKNESDHLTPIIRIKRTILLVLWVIGLISGALFLAIMILVFLKIPFHL